MKKQLFALLTAIVVIFSVMGMVACNTSGNQTLPTDFVNGGFETNADESTWTGWTKTGTAFSARGVITETKVNGIDVEKTGEKFFSGTDGGTQKMTGTLTSDKIKLEGTGKIAFKMGAGKHGDKIYVEFFEEGNNTAILTVKNDDFSEPYITDQLIRKIVDLSAYVGKTIYVTVTDNDNEDDFGYVNLDDFVVCKTQEDVTKYENERKEQLERYAVPEFNEDETQNTIVNGGFETGDLTGWKILSGTAFTAANVYRTSKYYWTDRSVYGNGQYYIDGNCNGNIPESAIGAMRSTKFTMAGDGYVSLMIGAAPANCYVAICDGNTDEELITITNKYFNDPKLALTLLRVYVDASEYIGRVLYIKVVDNNPGSGFAFINVDDFRVSLTEADVKALMLEQYNAIKNETYTSAAYNDLANLMAYYNAYEYPFALPVLKFETFVAGQAASPATGVNLNEYLKEAKAVYGEEEVTDIAIVSVKIGETEYAEGFDNFDLAEGTYEVTYKATHQNESVYAKFSIVVSNPINVANGGFETGNLTGWTVLTNGWGQTEGQYDGVISAATYWGEALTYNQEGNYHLDGWNNGIDEQASWAIRSSNFILSGTGYITARMGGNAAAVKVYKADGTLIGNFRQSRFNDSNFPFVADGGSWADMATYVMDLSAYVGQEIYIELHDLGGGSWAHAFFDAVNAYHETVPTAEGNYDVAIAPISKNEEGAIVYGEIQIAWVDAVNLVKPVEPEPDPGEQDNRKVVNGDFETGNLNGWTILTEGWAMIDGEPKGVINAQTYWGEKLPYNQEGNYHLDGWETGIGEAEAWAIRSTNFILSGSGYITVRMGGNAAAVKVYTKNGTLIGYYKANRFSDTDFPFAGTKGSWADMATYAIDLSAYLGKELYIELCDIGGGAWAHAFFDAVNTYYETAPAVAELADTVTAPISKDEAGALVYGEVQIKWVLAVNALVANGGFETGNLNGWTILTEGWGMVDGEPKGVINAQTYWGEKLPYNQEGNYHLDGWETGIGEAEAWAIRSTNFVLSGSGYITVRMGGNVAAVKVYTKDGTLIGNYAANRFSDTDFPFAGTKGSWADMATYAIDLSAYLGQELYIELCDTGSGAWAHAFFDAVNTYYETAPDVANLYDTVTAPISKDEAGALVYGEVQIKWVKL